MSSQKTESFALVDWGLLTATALIWGSSFLFTRVAVNTMTPTLVAFLRMVFGCLTLALLPAARKPVVRSDLPTVALVGVVWMAVPFLLFSIALQWIDSSLAGMLNAAAPLFAAVIAAVFWKRQPSRRQQLGLLVGFAGVLVVSGPRVAGAHATVLGTVLVLLAVLLYGVAINMLGPLQQRNGALPVIWRAEIVAMILLAPTGLLGLRHSTFAWSSVLAVGALGVFGTAMAFVAFTTLVGRVGSVRASVSIYFLPPVAIALGAIVRSEAIAATSLAGTALILAGAFLASRAEKLAVTPARVAKAAAVVLLVMTAAPGAGAQATETRPAMTLTRLTSPIVLDGRNGDAAWQAITPLATTVYRPSYRAAPSERTEVRVAYDDAAVYVMVDAWEAHPGSVRASTMIRDDDAPGDFINVVFDPFNDRQSGLSFSTTPGGGRNDFTISNDAPSYADISNAWNGAWDVATRRDDAGWHAEYRIPFSTLRIPATSGRVEFGLSVNRLTAHANERVTFPDIEPNTPTALWKPSRMQRVWVEDIHPAREVRLTPYAIAGVEGLRAPGVANAPLTTHQKYDAGGDVKLALTQALTLDLTANTDFAEAEVDDQRVNLTRFPLFFPERRPFFLERASTFELRTGESDLLFNSRRVGLTPLGEPVRLLGGARLVGRAGAWDVGLFDAQTGRTPTGSGENLGVLRVRRGALGGRALVGAMVTSRVAPDSSQGALGLDGELRLTGDDYLNVGLATLGGVPGAGPDSGFLPRSAVRLLVERRRNRGVWYRGAASSTGARYAPALGYVERADAIRSAGEVGYGRVASDEGHVLRGSVVSSLVHRNAARTLEGSAHSGVLSLEMPSGATWALSATRQGDELLFPFTPTKRTSIPVGRYAARFGELSFAPSTGPRAVVGLTARGGQYYDGTLYSLQLSPEWRASAHLRVAGDVRVDRVDFASRGEREWSRLARLRVLASASPQLSVTSVLQLNDQADLFTGNVRVRYNVREGHDLWVVYGHQLNTERNRTTPAMPAVARVALLVKYARSIGE